MELQEAIIFGLVVSALLLSLLAIVFAVVFFRIQTQQASSMTKENSSFAEEMKMLLSEIRMVQNITGQQVKDQYDKLLDAAISKGGGTVEAAAGSAVQFEELNSKFVSLEKAVAGLKDSGELQVQVEDLRESIEIMRKSIGGLVTEVASEERRKPEIRSRFEEFSERARVALTKSEEITRRLNHNYIGPEHILMSLFYDSQTIASKIMKNLGVEIDKVTNAVKFLLEPKPKKKGYREIGLGPQAKTVIELCVDEARHFDDHYIGTQHLLLGVLREGGVASNVLEKLNVTLDKVRTEASKSFSQLDREP